MLPELFILVVTTILPVTGTPNYTSTTVSTPKLTLEKCTTLRHAAYNEAVAKSINVVVKCVPQD